MVVMASVMSRKNKELMELLLVVLTVTLLASSMLLYKQGRGVPGNPVVSLPKAKFEINDPSKRKASMCKDTFAPTFEENLDVIKNYPKGIATPYLMKIGGNKTAPDVMRDIPVFVTAMDYKYYPFCQGMFYTLHTILNAERYKGKSKIIVYDLGLSARQLRILRKKCKCEIRKFPFEQFPPHVRKLKTYAFKPIVIQMTLMEFGFVWWTDISVKFLKFNLDSAFEYARNNHILIFGERQAPTKVTIAQQTDERTFEFLNEDICKFRAFGEMYATTVLFHFDEVTKIFVQSWAACALNEPCIAPVGEEKLGCDFFDPSDGRCHRFDQSMLSILYRRLYHDQNDYPLDESLNIIYNITRREFMNYFEHCRFEITCY